MLELSVLSWSVIYFRCLGLIEFCLFLSFSCPKSHFSSLSVILWYGCICMVAWLLGCLVAWLPGCLVAWLLGSLVVWLLGCLVACLFDCLVAWLFGCLVAWLVAWLLGCLVAANKFSKQTKTKTNFQQQKRFQKQNL